MGTRHRTEHVNVAIVGGTLRAPDDGPYVEAASGGGRRVEVWLDNPSLGGTRYDLHVRVIAVGGLADEIAALVGSDVTIKGRLSTQRGDRTEAVLVAEEVYPL